MNPNPEIEQRLAAFRESGWEWSKGFSVPIQSESGDPIGKVEDGLDEYQEPVRVFVRAIKSKNFMRRERAAGLSSAAVFRVKWETFMAKAKAVNEGSIYGVQYYLSLSNWEAFDPDVQAAPRQEDFFNQDQENQDQEIHGNIQPKQ